MLLLIIWGKSDEVITYYDKALAINSSDDYALYDKALALEELGKYEEAITNYDKALALNPRDADAAYN